MTTLYLRIQVSTIWILLQRLGVADRIALQDLESRTTFIIFYFQFRLNNLSSGKKYICIPETQFTSHSFDTATLVVSFLGLKISCLIRIMLELTINSDAFEFAVLTEPQLPRVILIKSDSNRVK